MQLLQDCKLTSGSTHQQLTNLSEAGPKGVDWIKLAQNRSW